MYKPTALLLSCGVLGMNDDDGDYDGNNITYPCISQLSKRNYKTMIAAMMNQIICHYSAQ